jgi:membrane-bound lytic murein transglycosylase MltF
VIEAEKSKELVANTPQEIAEKVLEKYNELFEKGDFVPNEIFSDNFFIATQLQESGYNSKAESSAGAFGVMQTMPITIKEVVRMLDVWKRKEGIGFACKKYDDMTSADVQEIKNLIQEDNNYGRAFGKLYFAGLYKIHKIGEKDFEKGDTKEAQKKLLASYNWNPKDFKKYENREKAWPKESRNYYKRIFRNMEYLELVKAKTKESQIKSNPNYISMRIVQNMNAYRKLNSNDELFEKLLDKYIENLKLSESSRYRKLRDHEIDEVINLTKGQLMRTYLAKVG